MRRTQRSWLLGMCLPAILTMLPAPSAGESPARPNIVLIIADDMAWDDCTPFGHPSIRTPNLERLAREGMRFDRAFVTTSSCSPSRSSLITGRYPHSTDAEELHWPLPAAQITFVERLKADGYYTAAAGKWHLGPEVKDRFDEVREANPRGYQLPSPGEPATDEPDSPASRIAFDGPGAAQSGCDQWVPVLKERPRDRPFFLWLASLDPHRDYQDNTIPEPHRPEDVVVPPTMPDTPEVRADLAQYYDEIARLDHFVGAVLDELEAQGVADDTIVLFLSDNGRPFPRDKTTLHDSGIRTPLLVRWPGRIAPASTCASLVSTVDIGPTLLDIARLDPLETAQGTSFAALLEDPSRSIREHVFAEHNWHDYSAFQRAVRSARYKYIRSWDYHLTLSPPADAVRSPSFQTMRRLRDAGTLEEAQRQTFLAPRPEEELYDLDSDPHELHNLAGDPAHAETLGRLRTRLAAWRRATEDAPPPQLSPDEFDRETGDPLPNRERPRPSKAERRKVR